MCEGICMSNTFIYRFYLLVSFGIAESKESYRRIILFSVESNSELAENS